MKRIKLPEEEKKFRLSGKNFFLTYPRCDVEPRDMLAFLKTKFEFIVYAKVVREKHSDEGKHLHCLIQSSVRKDIKSQDHLDYNLFHPNIQRAKNCDNCFKYTDKDKEDPDFAIAEEGKFVSSEEKKREKTEEKNLLILKTPLCELVDNGQIAIIQLPLFKKAKEYYSLEKQKMKMAKKELLGKKIIYQFGPEKYPRIMDFNVDLEKKNCHLWIHSPPNYGKTSFAIHLMKTYNAAMFQISLNNPHISQDTQIFCIDEVTPKNYLPRFFINQLCDGNAWINCKNGGFQQNPEKKALIIVLSNYAMEEVYQDKNDYDTVSIRFVQIDLEEMEVNPSSAGKIIKAPLIH